MSLFYTNHEINRRINEGCLPGERLYPVPMADVKMIDFYEAAKEALFELKIHPEQYSKQIGDSIARVIEYELEFGEKSFTGHTLNVYVNSKYSPDDFPGKECVSDDEPIISAAFCDAFLQAETLNPVVTYLDKILFIGALTSFLSFEVSRDDKTSRMNYSQMCLWIHFLLLAQENEGKYGNTISAEYAEIGEPLSLLYTILDWEGCPQERLTPLSDKEKTQLEFLTESRRRIQRMAQVEFEQSRRVAIQTQKEWEKFLQLINYLSVEELRVIRVITEKQSARDKLGAITQYNENLKLVRAGEYRIKNEPFSRETLTQALKRINHAPSYTNVFTESGEEIRLTPFISFLVLSLIAEPATFNYLLIKYHEFRLNSSNENALTFIRLARVCLERNLGFYSSTNNSLEEVAEEICSNVESFFERKKEIIKVISLPQIQHDAVLAFNFIAKIDTDWDFLYQCFNDQGGASDSEDTMIKRLSVFIRRNRGNDNSEVSADQFAAYVEELAGTRRIIASLNVIYLLCDALRIVLNASDKFSLKNPNAVNRFRRKMMEIEDYVFHASYSEIKSEMMDVYEYRELNTRNLSERETEEEQLRNSAFYFALKTEFSKLAEQIEGKSPRQVAKIKSTIRQRLLAYPECEAKEHLTDWVDQISTIICSSLVENCKKHPSRFYSEKMRIESFFGEEAKYLPDSTIDSLATAELLFAEYGTSEYASTGFDYSCISSLYYQAFEDAYNALIWRDYASLLNSLTIKNGTPFVSVLEKYKHKTIEDSAALGYLDKYSKTRDFYVDYAKKDDPLSVTQVRLSCMYKSFSILMSNLRPNSYLDKFCDYFAEKAGYLSKRDMIKDTQFVTECTQFISQINKSVGSRNNASHGGAAISLAQCSEDKDVVLYGLKQVRGQSVGLIQQMLHLLFIDNRKN